MRIMSVLFCGAYENSQLSQVLVAHAYNPSYSREKSGRSQFEASPGKEFTRPYLKNNQHKKGWRSGSSGGGPA
jgi:hypothetical protein